MAERLSPDEVKLIKPDPAAEPMPQKFSLVNASQVRVDPATSEPKQPTAHTNATRGDAATINFLDTLASPPVPKVGGVSAALAREDAVERALGLTHESHPIDIPDWGLSGNRPWYEKAASVAGGPITMGVDAIAQMVPSVLERSGDLARKNLLFAKSVASEALQGRHDTLDKAREAYDPTRYDNAENQLREDQPVGSFAGTVGTVFIPTPKVGLLDKFVKAGGAFSKIAGKLEKFEKPVADALRYGMSHSRSDSAGGVAEDTVTSGAQAALFAKYPALAPIAMEVGMELADKTGVIHLTDGQKAQYRLGALAALPQVGLNGLSQITKRVITPARERADNVVMNGERVVNSKGETEVRYKGILDKEAEREAPFNEHVDKARKTSIKNAKTLMSEHEGREKKAHDYLSEYVEAGQKEDATAGKAYDKEAKGANKAFQDYLKQRGRELVELERLKNQNGTQTKTAQAKYEQAKADLDLDRKAIDRSVFAKLGNESQRQQHLAIDISHLTPEEFNQLPPEVQQRVKATRSQLLGLAEEHMGPNAPYPADVAEAFGAERKAKLDNKAARIDKLKPEPVDEAELARRAAIKADPRKAVPLEEARAKAKDLGLNVSDEEADVLSKMFPLLKEAPVQRPPADILRTSKKTFEDIYGTPGVYKYENLSHEIPEMSALSAAQHFSDLADPAVIDPVSAPRGEGFGSSKFKAGVKPTVEGEATPVIRGPKGGTSSASKPMESQILDDLIKQTNEDPKLSEVEKAWRRQMLRSRAGNMTPVDPANPFGTDDLDSVPVPFERPEVRRAREFENVKSEAWNRVVKDTVKGAGAGTLGASVISHVLPNRAVELSTLLGALGGGGAAARDFIRDPAARAVAYTKLEGLTTLGGRSPTLKEKYGALLSDGVGTNEIRTAEDAHEADAFLKYIKQKLAK